MRSELLKWCVQTVYCGNKTAWQNHGVFETRKAANEDAKKRRAKLRKDGEPWRGAVRVVRRQVKF
jgi:hypothetical protein